MMTEEPHSRPPSLKIVIVGATPEGCYFGIRLSAAAAAAAAATSSTDQRSIESITLLGGIAPSIRPELISQSLTASASSASSGSIHPGPTLEIPLDTQSAIKNANMVLIFPITIDNSSKNKSNSTSTVTATTASEYANLLIDNDLPESSVIISIREYGTLLDPLEDQLKQRGGGSGRWIVLPACSGSGSHHIDLVSKDEGGTAKKELRMRRGEESKYEPIAVADCSDLNSDRVRQMMMSYGLLDDDDALQKMRDASRSVESMIQILLEFNNNNTTTASTIVDMELRTDVMDLLSGRLLLKLSEGVCAACGLHSSSRAILDPDARWCVGQCLKEGFRVLYEAGYRPKIMMENRFYKGTVGTSFVSFALLHMPHALCQYVPKDDGAGAGAGAGAGDDEKGETGVLSIVRILESNAGKTDIDWINGIIVSLGSKATSTTQTSPSTSPSSSSMTTEHSNTPANKLILEYVHYLERTWTKPKPFRTAKELRHGMEKIMKESKKRDGGDGDDSFWDELNFTCGTMFNLGC